uniref:Uncharacterized protein n=1 Tax=viral metagenome TaxID=1070528 RepID=A0A6C0DLF4_9ZZZZ
MVLSGPKRTSSIASIANYNTGGGNKKAGFPYQVGRISWTSIGMGAGSLLNGKCCTLKKTNTNLFPLARLSRPVGVSPAAVHYWN